jgi:cytochrome o ubiquinol oxidase subunit IV
MAQQHMITDYGTGEKKLSIYLIGFFACIILTLISFWLVMYKPFTVWTTFIGLYIAAIIQFFLQLICFIRLNVNSTPSKTNVMCLVFTGVILTSIIIGTLWIMANLNYNMVH